MSVSVRRPRARRLTGSVTSIKSVTICCHLLKSVTSHQIPICRAYGANGTAKLRLLYPHYTPLYSFPHARPLMQSDEMAEAVG